jgi:hypothetical protein
VLTFGLAALAIELRRWRAAARAVVGKIRPGKNLPVAVARTAPAEPAPAPSPPAAAAPSKVEPAPPPGDKPRFLT